MGEGEVCYDDYCDPSGYENSQTDGILNGCDIVINFTRKFCYIVE